MIAEGGVFAATSSWTMDSLVDSGILDPVTSQSTASSDCGDELSIGLGMTECSIFSWNDSDSFENPLSQVIEGSCSSANELIDSVSTSLITMKDNTRTPTSRRKQKKKMTNFNLDLADTKKWSELRDTEQVEVVEKLTGVISTEMALCEQMQVIRIIDPSAVISGSDTEFVIDMSCINDDKWSAIKELVQKIMQVKTQTKTQNRKNTKSRSQTNASPRQENKKTAKQHQRMQMKAMKEELRKRHRQLIKEQRSGLFHKEEILSLTSLHQLEDEDIDILD